MGSIKLPHASGNSMSIAAPATNPASDLELKLPATVGTAGQFLTVDGSGNLTWANPPGVTHADCWRITADFTNNQTPVSANLERAIDANGNDGYGTIGDPMTVSSGVWTFPVTGIWRVELNAWYSNTNPSATTNSVIKNSIVDINDLSNRKVRFDISHEATTVTCHGAADKNETCMFFTRLGDT